MSTAEGAPILGKDALGRVVRDLSVESWWGLSRKEIDWSPSIDYDKCATCGICFVTCGRRVFDFDKDQKRIVVARPYNCMVACQTCANLCPTNAISFPDVKYIKILVARNKVVKKAFQAICRLIQDEEISERDMETHPDSN